MKLKCDNCGYKQEKDQVPRRCGYCGVEGAMKPEVTAGGVLRDLK